jgi:hypothetical protein
MNRFGHDAPCLGALWQVPARRLETAGSGRSQCAGFGIPVKIVAGRQFDYGYEYGQDSLK